MYRIVPARSIFFPFFDPDGVRGCRFLGSILCTSQSVKLAVFETVVDETIERTRKIPGER